MLWKCKCQSWKALTALLVAAGKMEKRTLMHCIFNPDVRTVETNSGQTEATALLTALHKVPW